MGMMSSQRRRQFRGKYKGDERDPNEKHLLLFLRVFGGGICVLNLEKIDSSFFCDLLKYVSSNLSVHKGTREFVRITELYN